MMMASEKAAMDLVHMLLDYGPDYDATDLHGCTIFEEVADIGLGVCPRLGLVSVGCDILLIAIVKCGG